MKYFIDTEFLETNTNTYLISIGIYSEKGDKFYAECIDFPVDLISDWLKENVVPHLMYFGIKNGRMVPGGNMNDIPEVLQDASLCWYPKEDIKDEIVHFIGDDKEPEFYAYYGAYDWVLFAKLWGKLLDMPDHWPIYYTDLKVMMDERGLSKDWKRKNCPEDHQAHMALSDAIWNKKLYDAMMEHDKSIEALRLT